MSPKKKPELIPAISFEPAPVSAYKDLALVLRAAHWAHVFQTERRGKGAIPPEYLERGLAESRLLEVELKARDLHL